MERTKDIDITVDSSILAQFQNMPMEMFKVFREFIDNSLQSYWDHKEKLDSLPGSPKKLVVQIEWTKSEIVITDNAWGMDEEAFGRALKLNKPSERADENDRLSRFGWGLKTAACYASRDYIITSVAYGSQNRYKAEMDIDYIKAYAPKTSRVTISDCLPSEHGTVIRLKKLNPRCTFNSNVEKKVRTKLARIYNRIIGDGALEISINNEVIIYEEPIMYIDPKTGTEALRTFANDQGFEFEGKRYKYEGWLGVIKKGDASGDTTGFQYYQANRIIVFSDHPHELFGSNNDARFQHVIGEIRLLGNEWPITTNKDKILWQDNGLREAFIQDLLREKDVQYVFKLAKNTKFRSNSKPVNRPEPVSPSPINSPVEPVSDPANPPISQPTVPTIVSDPITTKIQKKVTYNQTTYKIDFVSFTDDPDRDWFNLKIPESEQDPAHIEIEINLSAPMIAEYSSSPTVEKIIFKFAEVFALARIEAMKSGLKMNDSFAIEQAINDIMRKAK